MKKDCSIGSPDPGIKKKWRRIMRLTLFLVIGFFLTTAGANSYSQNTRLSVKLKNGTVTEFMKTVEDNSEFVFLYKKEDMDLEKKVNVELENETIHKILDAGLKGQNVVWDVYDRQIVIHRADKLSLPRQPFQQQRAVTGVVTDTNGKPLPGVSVVVSGTTTGTITNANGEFSLAVPEDAESLQFSFVGMHTKQVSIEGRTTITVVMEEDVFGIEEIVAIGYGVQKKTSVTGAISTIKGEDLKVPSVSDISQTMAGRLTGISMRPDGGQPGYDDPILHIRGVVTTGDNSPLIVVDGIKRDNIRQIDPNSIESVTILKDAAAVAPYGIGGANGVILITTKKGDSGRPVVRLNSSFGIQNPTYLPDMLNAQDYMFLQNEGYWNLTPDGDSPPWDPALVEDYMKHHKEDPWNYPSSDFVDLFNLNVPVQNYDIELSGGNETMKYHAGVGYYDQKGIFDVMNYKRYNYNMSLDIQATPTTKINMSLHGAVETTNEQDADEPTWHLFRSFYKFVPTAHLMYPDGEHWGESSASSPVAALKSNGYRKTDRNTLLGSISIEQELPFIKGLSIKGIFSYDPYHMNIKSYHEPFVYHNVDLTTEPYTFTENLTTSEGQVVTYTWLELENRRRTNYTYQGYINYNRTFGDHELSGLFVAEGRNNTYNEFTARRNNFSINIDELDLGSSDKTDFDNGGSSSTGSELGFVYRLGYVYKNKYIFEASGRYDGHYYFAPDDRWGYFPAFSAAWRISEENFMNGFSNIDNLKLRGSWGKSGNLAGSAFQYLSGYELRGNAYIFGTGSIVQGSEMTQEANPNITWEVSTKFDIGFDLNMWNGLLNLEFDYFYEHRTNMLLQPQVILPVEYGLDLAQENKGEMKSNGFEFIAGTRKTFSNGLEMNITANLSYAKNKMIEVYETDAQRNNPNRTLVGRQYGTPFGYKSLGLFSTDDDLNGDGIINSDDGYNIVQFGDLHPGDVRYADLSGPEGEPDGKIDSNDFCPIGDPTYPALTYGLITDFKWKNFDLSLFFQGAAKSSISTYQYLLVPFFNNASNMSYTYFNNRWTKDNQDAKYPRSTTAPYNNNTQTSDFWYESTAYLRLKTFTLGYTIPKKITDKLTIEGIRCYFSTQNLFTLSGLKHVDPELGPSVREESYPVMKSTTLGIDITF
jgi:TonB-linked SusC/RagA family outer membrane protein